MSALVNGLTCLILNENHSVHHSVRSNVELIHECLFPFPYLWASVIKLQLVVDT